MHAATMQSDRLRRVLMLLHQSGPLTTMEIVQGARVCAVNSIIAELRANGHDIECRPLKRGVYEYELRTAVMGNE